MSCLTIISEVWWNGALMLSASLTSLNVWLTQKMLSWFEPRDRKEPTSELGTNTHATITSDSSTLVLATHNQPFPSLPTFEDPADELDAMNAYHTVTDMLPPLHPCFPPDLRPLDPKMAVVILIKWDADLLVHKAEARDAFNMAFHFSYRTAFSRYQPTHTAFTSAGCSILAQEFHRYISLTHASTPSGIRVAPAWQIHQELSTCLSFAFVQYMESYPGDAEGQRKVVPDLIAPLLRDAARGHVVQLREAIEYCEMGFVNGGEEFLEIWKAWLWVLKCYVGLLVMRDRTRVKEHVIWG